MKEWCRKGLANYKVPKSFEFRSKMPMLGTGKIDKMTLSKAIRKLEESKLIRRQPSITDTRTMQVQFTASGRRLVHRAIIAVERADDEFFSCLTEGQMKIWKALAASLITGSNE